MYLKFQQKLTDFAVRLLDLNINKLKQKQINLIKIELLDLINEAKELEKFFVSSEDNDVMYKLTCENITSFIEVLNNTVIINNDLGVLRQEGNIIVFETADSIIELGENLGDVKASDIDMLFVSSITENTVTITGQEFSIIKSSNGNVESLRAGNNILNDELINILVDTHLAKLELHPINKELTGTYYVMTVEVTHETLQEFDRKVSINENVLRHLIIKVEGE